MPEIERITNAIISVAEAKYYNKNKYYIQEGDKQGWYPCCIETIICEFYNYWADDTSTGEVFTDYWNPFDPYEPPERTEAEPCEEVFRNLLDLTEQEASWFADDDIINVDDWDRFGKQTERMVHIQLLMNVFRRHFENEDIEMMENDGVWDILWNGNRLTRVNKKGV